MPHELNEKEWRVVKCQIKQLNRWKKKDTIRFIFSTFHFTFFSRFHLTKSYTTKCTIGNGKYSHTVKVHSNFSTKEIIIPSLFTLSPNSAINDLIFLSSDLITISSKWIVRHTVHATTQKDWDISVSDKSSDIDKWYKSHLEEIDNVAFFSTSP